MLDEPLGAVEARQLIRRILRDGTYSFTRHAEQRMSERDLTHVDCVNALRAGFVREEYTTFEHGTWRYRAETPAVGAVVAFRTENNLVVVTVMRLL